MDLLLHLIEKAEVDIKDIFVSEITSQYLDYMKGLDELEPDAASEFAAMAATLLLIKSRMLLPKPEPLEQEEEEDPETVLLRQIREYKLFKEASEELSSLKATADRLFVRLPEEFPKQPPKVDLDGVTTDALYEAFMKLLLRAGSGEQANAVRRVSRDAYNISDKLEYLESVLKSRGSIRFTELFSAESPKLERIVTFMALLELLSSGVATARQHEPFGDIIIAATNGSGEGYA
ncbi:MAG: segregation and condensation protein A [Christensenellales bacterium]